MASASDCKNYYGSQMSTNEVNINNVETASDFFNQTEDRIISNNINSLIDLRGLKRRKKSGNASGCAELDHELLIELLRQYQCIWNIKLNVHKDQPKLVESSLLQNC